MSAENVPLVSVDPPRHGRSPTAGIQEAVDALPEGGGVVFVPRGTYPVRRCIVLRSGVTLRGEGTATVLLRPVPVLFDLTATAPAQPVEAELSTVEGLRPGDEIYVTDAGQGGWHARHLVITSIADKLVQGTLVAGESQRSYSPESAARGGNFFPMILIPGGDSAMVADLAIDGGPRDCDPERMPGFTCAAIHGVNAENLRVRGVTVRRWPGDGIGAQGGSAIVTECVVEDCLGHGFHPGTGVSRSIWTNNIGRRNGGDGFFFCRAVRHAVVSGNELIDNRMNGIGNLSAPDAYNVVTGNVIAGNGRHGIEAFESLGNVIGNNLIRNNSQSCAGRFAGIRLESHADTVVTGNLCLDTQTPPTQTTGIELVDPAGENTVSGNSGSVASVQAADPLPRGEIRAAANPPVIDGRLDEPVWRAADELPLARHVEDGAPVGVTASARFLRDDRFLYIGVHCSEPYMDRMHDKVTGRHGAVWTENCVELYFMPDAGAPLCCQLAVNSLGAMFEREYERDRVSAWESGARVAAYRGRDYWSLEIAVPLAALGPDGLPAGRECRANVYRTRQTVTPPERSCWSPTRASFLMPRRFGLLRVK